MAGNSRGVGTKDLGCICFIIFFININSLVEKDRKEVEGKQYDGLTNADNLKGKKTKRRTKILIFELWQELTHAGKSEDMTHRQEL